MSEMDVDERIRNYWRRKELMLSDEDSARLDELAASLQFRDATAGTPVPAIEFCSHLNCEGLVPFMEGAYRRFETVRDRLVPKMRFLAFMCMSGRRNISDAFCAVVGDNGWKRLGFREKPVYETLREFINERIGDSRLHELFHAIVAECVRAASSMGVEIGRRVGEDATDIRSLKFDDEAEYSGYYRHHGYKVDMVHDLDDQSLVLDYTPMGINGDEGECLMQSQQRLAADGIRTVEQKVDGKYTSYRNIAHSGINGIRLQYRIERDWRHNTAGEEHEIRCLYQKYHDDACFKTGAAITDMLIFLYNRGEYEAVGSYFRNSVMAVAETDPDGHARICNERSGRTEGMVAVTKSTTSMDARPYRRGRKWFERSCHFTFIGKIFAALVRLQHGIKTHLGSLTYIT